ncbi:MAG TPA: zinc ribbon domain-containing protein [Polyangia bacterium]|nr:zinc ribbon domain-containing protein [Polyangia bacterium]
MTETRETGEPAAPPRRRRFPLWAIALLGACAAALYGATVEKLRLGPPFVMLSLGGMTVALAGAALYRVIDPLARAADAAPPVRTGRRLKELEREKQLVLKAIKEIELDYQMRKIADRDYREMVERYRTRAMRLITEIEAGDDYRALIERELAMRLKLAGEPAAAPAEPVAAPHTCAACGARNDDDAQFCKKCGQRL